MQTTQKRNLTTPTVSEAIGRIRFLMLQGARMIVATLAIVVVIVSVFAWVRSFVVGEKSYFATRLGSIEWRENRGYAMLRIHDQHPTPNDPATRQRLGAFAFGVRDDTERIVLNFDVLRWDFQSRRHFGFGVDRRDVERFFDHQGKFALRATAVRAPLWFPTLLGLVTAFLLLRGVRRDWYATSPTRCRKCGYDLRTGHDKCPECGGESHVREVAAVK